MNPYLSKEPQKFNALILAGGRGKRLNEYTKEENKCMLQHKGKPLIEYSLDNALKIGVQKIIIVVGYLPESIINHYGNFYKGVPIRYVFQKEQLGVVHAIGCAKQELSDSDFLLFLGDEFLLNPDHKNLIETFIKEDAFVVCGVIKVDNRNQISKTYSILYDKESKQIFRLIEKPKNPTNNLMGTGNIVFKKEILDYLEKTPINQQRGEQELPDLVQCAIDEGKKVFFHQIGETYINVNTPEDILIQKNVT
ncbi:MAG: sugar phosphate nucleotidyltransferase [Candidatus Pacearchaeota archaeon]|nr:sugar phosphate nucleotidyltransferase [Candidatus Pacearchaeota archaeon]